MNLKHIFSIIAVIAVIIISAICVGYERVDAGHEGIKVNLYGDNKGVDDVKLVTGAQWYNKFTTAIYEYPTHVMSVDYPSFSINAKDGSSFTVDPSIALKIIDGQAPYVFVKYRKDDIMDIVNGPIYTYIKDAFRIELNKYTTDELVSKREQFENSIENRLIEELKNEGFQLDKVTSGLQYPGSLVSAINSKNAMIQEAQKIENEVLAIEAEAKKKIAEARGIADALRIKGDAEAEYNRKISNSLSLLIVQKQFVDTWDGKLPVYGEVPTLFKSVSK